MEHSESAFDWLGRYKAPGGGTLAQALLQLLSSLRQRDARNSGAAAAHVASFFRTVLSTVSGKSLPVDAVLQHIATIEGRLQSAAGAEFIAANVARRVARFVVEEADKRAAAAANSSATAAGARSAADGLSAGAAGGAKGASAELATVTLTVGRSASSDDHATAGSLDAASGLGRASTSGSGGVSAEASVAEAGAGGGAVTAPAGSATAPASGVAAVADVRSACADALSRWHGQQQAQQQARAGAAATGADIAAAGGSSGSSAGKHASGSGRYGDMAFAAIRGGVLDALNELHDELDSASATLCASAADLLSHGDVVLVAGYDAAVRDFLLAAAKRRRVGEIIVCEGSDAAPLPAPSTSAPGASSSAGAPAPIFPGQALALELTGRAKPLPVTVIPDADAAAVVHRVHKVILGARGVTADGAVAADAPAFLLTLAAGRAVPVIVLANALRFIPESRIASHAQLSSAADVYGAADPHTVLPRAAVDAAEAAFARARVLQGGGADDGSSCCCAEAAEQGVEVVAHSLDVLPPSAVSLIVTNTGVVTPAQGGRVTAELYGDVA